MFDWIKAVWNFFRKMPEIIVVTTYAFIGYLILNLIVRFLSWTNPRAHERLMRALQIDDENDTQEQQQQQQQQQQGNEPSTSGEGEEQDFWKIQFRIVAELDDNSLPTIVGIAATEDFIPVHRSELLRQPPPTVTIFLPWQRLRPFAETAV